MTNTYSRKDLPEAIRQYLDSKRASAADTAMVAFAANATVLDEGHTYEGTESIRAWLGSAGSQYTYTTTETGYEQISDGRYIVHLHLEGNFPGGVADLAATFTLADAQISRLEML